MVEFLFQVLGALLNLRLLLYKVLCLLVRKFLLPLPLFILLLKFKYFLLIHLQYNRKFINFLLLLCYLFCKLSFLLLEEGLQSVSLFEELVPLPMSFLGVA